MALNYAWAGFSEECRSENGGIPKDVYDQLRPEADALRDDERQRLLELLGPDWH